MTGKRVGLAVALWVAGLLAACGGGAGTSGGASATSAVTGRTDAAGVTWLCRPGLADDPCAGDLTTTVIGPGGSRRVVDRRPAADPPIDCFYVYPTVSTERTGNADLRVQAAEIQVAIAQAAPFSLDCRVWAPMYRQATLYALLGRSTTPVDRAQALDDVLAAWHDYLAHHNHGRGVVLIGHSQGAFVLTQLIQKAVDGVPSARADLVSAVLLGGNVTVPDGRDVGGSFAHVPVCRSATQTGCVIAYSTFAASVPPPAGSLFGRTSTAGMHVVCTNPAALGGGSGSLVPEFPTRLSSLPGVFGGLASLVPKVSTPWVTLTSQLTGRCETAGGATWLSLSATTAAASVLLDKAAHVLPATWGTHLIDANAAMGNLVGVVAVQAHQWVRHH